MILAVGLSISDAELSSCLINFLHFLEWSRCRHGHSGQARDATLTKKMPRLRHRHWGLKVLLCSHLTYRAIAVVFTLCLPLTLSLSLSVLSSCSLLKLWLFPLIAASLFLSPPHIFIRHYCSLNCCQFENNIYTQFYSVFGALKRSHTQSAVSPPHSPSLFLTLLPYFFRSHLQV